MLFRLVAVWTACTIALAFANLNLGWVFGQGVEFEFEVIARTGEDSGIVMLIPFENFREFGSDVNGQTSFIANLELTTGIEEDADEALLVADAKNISVIAQEGDSVPGVEPESVFVQQGFNAPVFFFSATTNNSTIFRAEFDGPAINEENNFAVFEYINGNTNLILRTGQPSPIAPYSFTEISDLKIDLDGALTFFAELTNDQDPQDTTEAIFSGANGNFTPVAQRFVDTLPPPFNFILLSNMFGFARNANDEFAIASGLTGPTVNIFNRDVILAKSTASGEFRQIVRGGDPVPAGDGFQFGGTGGDSFPAMAITADNKVVFISQLIVQSTFATSAGVYLETDRGVQKIARIGDVAPGAIDEAIFANFDTATTFRNLSANGAGEFFFEGVLQNISGGLGSGGIWIYQDGALNLAIRTGTIAPGTNDSTFNGFERFWQNDVGQFAIFASTNRVDSPFAERGIWVTGSSGLLSLVAIEQQEFDVNDDPLVEDLRLVEEINASTETDVPLIDNQGRITFSLRFSDGTAGLFTVQVNGDQMTFDTISLSDEPDFEEPLKHFAFIGTNPTSGSNSPNIPPLINNAGDVLFYSFDRNALFRDSDGQTELVFLREDPAPGIPNQNFNVENGFFFANLNDNGDIIFRAELEDDQENDFEGIWLESDGIFSPLVLSGQTAPGVPESFQYDLLFNSIGLNSADQVIFSANLSDGPSPTTGIWVSAGGSTQLVARERNPAPNTEDGVTYSNLSTPFLNANGFAVFQSILSQPTSGSAQGVFGFQNGVTGLIAKTGDELPFFGNGAQINELSLLSLSNTNQILLSANLSGGQFGIEGRNCLLVSDGQNFEIIAQEGEPAPVDGVPDAVFTSIFDGKMNGSGEIAFLAIIDGTGVNNTNQGTLFRFANGTISQVARNGDPVPGGAGKIQNIFSNFTINDSGQLLFATGGSFNFENFSGLFVQDREGMLKTAFQFGGLIDSNFGERSIELKEITSISINSTSTNSEGLSRSFNNDGEFVLILEFDETEQVILKGKIVEDLLLGDINQDGVVDLLDISPFVKLLAAGGFQVEADINQDGVFDLLDVALFVDLLST